MTAAQVKSSDADKSITTILVDDSGNKVNEWKSPNTITVTLEQLLSLAGLDLDTHNMKAGVR